MGRPYVRSILHRPRIRVSRSARGGNRVVGSPRDQRNRHDAIASRDAGVLMARGRRPGGNDYTVPALARGVEILEALAAERGPLSAATLADRLGLPRSSVFRLIFTLEQKGLIEV